jgi:hypothetical protein
MYRGKRIDNGEWVHGWHMQTGVSKQVDWIIKPYLFCADIILGIDESKPKHLNGCYEVIPETVGQSTGIKDIESVETYLGDMIEHAKQTYEIKWCKEGMGFYCDGNDWIDNAKLIRRSKIIGTIHDTGKEGV